MESKNVNLNISIQYAEDVINEKIPAGKYIKSACKNFLAFLQRTDLEYKENEVDKIITFISSLNLTEQTTPKHFVPEPWQIFIIANIYGFYFKGTDKRKHKYIYIEIPRKNGKSMLVNALSIYHLIFDNDSQIVVSANSREQAKNVNFKQAKNYCDQLDPKKKSLKQYYSKIKFGKNELIVTASDSKKLDGLNCSVAIVDELHAADNSGMYDVLKSSQGSRLNPLLLVITTAGFNTDSFCYSLRTYAIDILEGNKTDESQFTLIYTLDEGDEYTEKTNWLKCNPNLGVSIYEDFLENEVTKAKQNPVETSGVKVKNFNIWLQNKNEEQKYIEMEFINKSMNNISITDEKFNGVPCWVGVDLAAVSDITAVSYLIQLDEHLYYLNEYFLPEHSLNSNKNRLMYKQFSEQGYINITEGNVTDYEYILKDIIKKNSTNEIELISYDSWNSTQFAISTTDAGFNMSPYSQSTNSINKPMKELSRLVMNGNLIIQENPVTKWMFNNVIIKEYNGNIRPDKNSRSEKIDGVMAMLMALGGYLNSPHYSFNVW